MRQHIEVTKPVDDSRLRPVLPRAGSGGSKAMYSNDTGRYIKRNPNRAQNTAYSTDVLSSASSAGYILSKRPSGGSVESYVTVMRIDKISRLVLLYLLP